MLVGQCQEPVRRADAGRVTASGEIACDCQDCEGAAVRLSEFEEHSGSWDRQPAESIHLSALGVSLKVCRLHCALCIPPWQMRASHQSERAHPSIMLMELTAYSHRNEPPRPSIGRSSNVCKHNLTLSVEQELCVSVNEALGVQASLNGSLQRPPQRERQCQVCQQRSTGLLRCGGGCKTRAHAACVGMDENYQVR